MRIFGYSWPTDMRILVGRVLHIGTESTLKMSYLLFFCSSSRDIWLPKGDTIAQEDPSLYVSWTIQYTRLSCAHSGQLKRLCQEKFL